MKTIRDACEHAFEPTKKTIEAKNNKIKRRKNDWKIFWRTILGLKGGWTSLDSILSQSIRRKNGWVRTSSSPLAVHPSRLTGCLVKS